MAKIPDKLSTLLKDKVLSKKNGQNSAQDNIKFSLKIIAENTTGFDTLARDMNVARQNVQRLVKIMGGKPITKADDQFRSEEQRIKLTEKRRKELKAEQVKKEKEPSKIRETKKTSFFQKMKMKVGDKFKMTGLGKKAIDLKNILSESSFLSAFRKFLSVGLIVGFIFTAFKDALTELVSNLWSSLKEKFKDILQNIKDWFSDAIKPLIDGVKKYVKQIIDKVSEFFKPIGEWFYKKFEQIRDLFEPIIVLIGKIFDNIKNVIGAAITKVLSIPGIQAFIPDSVLEAIRFFGIKVPEPSKPQTSPVDSARKAQQSADERAAEATTPEERERLIREGNQRQREAQQRELERRNRRRENERRARSGQPLLSTPSEGTAYPESGTEQPAPSAPAVESRRDEAPATEPSKPEPRREVAPAPTPPGEEEAPKPEPRPAPASRPAPAPPGEEEAPKPEPRREAPKPEPRPEPAPRPAPAPPGEEEITKPEPRPAPAPSPEPKPEPAPKPAPEPAPKPAPEPAPAPAGKPGAEGAPAPAVPKISPPRPSGPPPESGTEQPLAGTPGAPGPSAPAPKQAPKAMPSVLPPGEEPGPVPKTKPSGTPYPESGMEQAPAGAPGPSAPEPKPTPTPAPRPSGPPPESGTEQPLAEPTPKPSPTPAPRPSGPPPESGTEQPTEAPKAEPVKEPPMRIEVRGVGQPQPSVAPPGEEPGPVPKTKPSGTPYPESGTEQAPALSEAETRAFNEEVQRAERERQKQKEDSRAALNRENRKIEADEQQRKDEEEKRRTDARNAALRSDREIEEQNRRDASAKRIKEAEDKSQDKLKKDTARAAEQESAAMNPPVRGPNNEKLFRDPKTGQIGYNVGTGKNIRFVPVPGVKIVEDISPGAPEAAGQITPTPSPGAPEADRAIKPSPVPKKQPTTTEVDKDFLQKYSKTESEGKYDTVFGRRFGAPGQAKINGKPVTENTIAEVIAWQQTQKKENRQAAGKYQIMDVEGAAKLAGLKETDLFDKAAQDKMADALYKQNVQLLKNKGIDPTPANLDLAFSLGHSNVGKLYKAQKDGRGKEKVVDILGWKKGDPRRETNPQLEVSVDEYLAGKQKLHGEKPTKPAPAAPAPVAPKPEPAPATTPATKPAPAAPAPVAPKPEPAPATTPATKPAPATAPTQRPDVSNIPDTGVPNLVGEKPVGEKVYATDSSSKKADASINSPSLFRPAPAHKGKPPGAIEPHGGVDIITRDILPGGLPVKMKVPGTVVLAGFSPSYGNMVDVELENGEIFRFAHLRFIDPKIKVGEKISSGQPIGAVGTTGRSEKDHLHFEHRLSSKGPDAKYSLDPVATGATKYITIGDREVNIYKDEASKFQRPEMKRPPPGKSKLEFPSISQTDNTSGRQLAQQSTDVENGQNAQRAQAPIVISQGTPTIIRQGTVKPDSDSSESPPEDAFRLALTRAV